MPRTFNIINALLGVAIIALLASIASDSLSLRLTKAVLPKGEKHASAPVPAPARIEELSFYAPILTNALFGNSARGTLAAITNTPAASAAPAVAPPELMLLGTVVGSFRETFALVRHATKKEERVFRLGEPVFDVGRLVEVNKEQAYIVINGKKVELLTPFTPPAATAGQAHPAVQPGVAVAATVAGSYVIDQRALNMALDNPAQAMTDARLLPSQRDGKIEGFKASEVKPNGVFSMIGIKNGDLLLRLNDFPMDSPDKALQSFIALKGQNRLKLDIIRDGQPQTFNYDIR